jgi:hypothetical protein
LSLAYFAIRAKSDLGAECGMTKINLHRNCSIFVLAVVCAALASLIPGSVSAAGKPSPAAKQQKSEEAGRLIIVRAANLGTTGVGLSIDGKETAKLNFGGRYDAPLAAGQHVLTVIPFPNREQAQPNQTRVTVQPGQTYKFTAKQSDVAIVLK